MFFEAPGISELPVASATSFSETGRRWWVPLILCCCLILACGGLLSCKNETRTGAERVAVVQFQNISGDPDLDWATALPSAIISAELTGDTSMDARAAVSLRDAFTFRADRIVEGYLTGQDGEFEVRAVVMRSAGPQIEKEFEVQADGPGGLLEVARAVTRHLGGPFRSFGTEDDAALREFGLALTRESAEERLDGIERAIEADPDFAEAVVAKAELLGRLRSEEEAADWLASSLSRTDAFDALTRARLKYMAAAAGGDPAATTAAVLNLAAMLPADASMARQAAQLLSAERRYAEAGKWYGRAATAESSSVGDWNSRAYALAYAGDAGGALASARRYRELDNGSPNGWDSEGEILYRFRRYEEAETCFRKAHEISPEFHDSAALVKIARCRMLAGNLAGADEVFGEYIQLRRDLHDAEIGLEHARWLFSTGRRREAFSKLEHLIVASADEPNLAAAATEHQAFWTLLTGDGEAAAEIAKSGLAQATAPQVRGAIQFQSFLAMNRESLEDWEQLANEWFPHPQEAGLRKRGVATALLLSGLFGEAAGPLRELVDSSRAFTEDYWRFLLGWALYETGETAETAEILRFNPLLPPQGSSMMEALVFPRILYLRGALAAASGNNDERDANLNLFLRYSGDMPLATGEVTKARKLLGEG